ncbi:MAG: hypothetical protein ACO24H_08560 [Polynucleobacter sp.]
MSEEYEYAMNMLFTAKWNIPKAAISLGLGNTEKGWEATKQMFTQYCAGQKMRYNG